MERRFEQRKQEALAECELDPRVWEGMLRRLGEFLVPFAEHLLAPAQREHEDEKGARNRLSVSWTGPEGAVSRSGS